MTETFLVVTGVVQAALGKFAVMALSTQDLANFVTMETQRQVMAAQAHVKVNAAAMGKSMLELANNVTTATW